MSTERSRALAGVIVKLAIFTAVSLVLTVVVVASLLNLDTSKSHTYSAMFTDASALQGGDAVRIAGVEVGRVKSVRLEPDAAKVSFTVDDSQTVTQTSTAKIEFENLFGQRNLTIVGGSPSGAQNPKQTMPLSRTSPALDLTDLFNGFQPLFQALTPSQINELTGNIIGAFQGQGSNLAGLVTETAQLTTNLAGRQQVIDQVVDNLSSLLKVAGAHDAQIGQLVDSFSQLATNLAGDRGNISTALGNFSNLTGSLDGLVSQVQPPLESAIGHLVGVTGTIAANQGHLNDLVNSVAPTLTTLTTLFQSGTFANVYLCQLNIIVNKPLMFTPIEGLGSLLSTVAPSIEGILAPIVNGLGNVGPVNIGGLTDLTQGGIHVANGPTGNPALHTANCS